MKPYKILKSAEEATYFQDPEDSTDELDNSFDYIHENPSIFSEQSKIKFLSEIKKHSNPKHQEGYSKTEQCDFISLVLVMIHYGDGEFQGHQIKSTYLIKKDGKISDKNNNENEYGEYSISISTSYHVLPNGDLIEFKMNSFEYEKEVEEIYNTVKKIRTYTILDRNLSNTIDKNTSKTKLKI